MFLLRKFKFVVAMFAMFMGVVSMPFVAHAESTPEQAKALAEKAAEYAREHGKEAALAEFQKPESEFIQGDLYVFANSLDGVALAHPIKPALVGKSLIDLKDVEGTPFMKAMTEVDGEGWVEYKWPHPTSKKVVPKKSYIIIVDDYLVGVGVYY